jgi:hypothetical protein
MPTLSQNVQQYFNSQVKIFKNILRLGQNAKDQNMIWLVLKLCGSKFDTRTELIYFEPMFLACGLR